MSEPKMQDSGERRTFASGAVRDRGTFKPRPDLISPHANRREGAWLAVGAEKYDARNWEKGIPIGDCMASLCRHVEAYKLGLKDEDHMAAIRTNAGFILHFEEEIKAGRMAPAIDDMPKYAQQDYPCIAGPTTISGGVDIVRAVTKCDYRPVKNDPVSPKCDINTPCPDQYEPACNGCGVNTPRKPTAYIAGPMRGMIDYNFPAFDAARDRFKYLGYDVISPADLDRAAGFDPTANPNAVWNGDKVAVMKRDIEAILENLRPTSLDAIALLPGWEYSEGAAVEVALGKFLGLNFIDAVTGATMEMK